MTLRSLYSSRYLDKYETTTFMYAKTLITVAVKEIQRSYSSWVGHIIFAY